MKREQRTPSAIARIAIGYVLFAGSHQLLAQEPDDGPLTQRGPINVTQSAGNGDDGGTFPIFGGDGENGANSTAGPVNWDGASNDEEIVSDADNAHGINVQRRGGQGGDGGDGIGLFLPGVGGDGGHGGNGGAISILSNGAITTDGRSARGIVALSRGNDGGDGGTAIGIFGDGGSGGLGGRGSAISVNTLGSIRTSGTFADGILARSTGASGGTGGGGGGLVGIGGGSDDGGAGGSVTVTNRGAITTSGSNARGIVAQSIGGFGGSGAGAGGLVGVGGQGSTGGNGGVVNVANIGAIATDGFRARGIVAQSIGGGGGDGAGAGGIVAIGGFGGSAGQGNNVRVDNNSGSITTSGALATGIVAQSVGGGGGSGAGSGGAVAVGGGGQSGGNARVVQVFNSGSIETQGVGARGIVAQSIGAGGGDGVGAGGFVAVGGSGSSSGFGEQVTVINSGSIRTQTTSTTLDDSRFFLTPLRIVSAHGILAQSIGGGGGSGAGAGGIVSVGGSGGAGGNGGIVNVGNSGIIETSADYSRGIIAQSIGGGGGDGGGSGGAVSIGGTSSGLGDGAAVEVRNTGTIITRGEVAHAIDAQSIGGGGGTGGSTLGMVTVGGGGLGGGGAGIVTVLNDGVLSTSGDDAVGILAQSIGGGGGNGGGSLGLGFYVGFSLGGSSGLGGVGNEVIVNSSDGSITTGGERSHGIHGQSVGGGGGSGGHGVALAGGSGGAVSLGIGGRGGDGGDANKVTITNASTINTSGNDANALFAQSVGGGGGSGGLSISGAASGNIGIAVSLGGSGGDGGDGNEVILTNSGNLATFGDNAVGVYGQSVGGGGGDGGASISGAAAGRGAGVLSIGGSGGDGGIGKTVTVANEGNITTSGDAAYGLLAHSVGGGGGNGGISIAASAAGSGSGAIGIGGSGGDGGDGGVVTVNNGISSGGDIATTGNGATALVAQSIGGGGGNGNFTASLSGLGQYAGVIGIGGTGGLGGDGKKVSLDSATSITTVGSDARGLLVQSIGGGGGNGDFSITGSAASRGAVGISIGGSGGSGGVGGNVDATNGARIVTSGRNGTGMQVQSIGGGGGSGGLSFAGSIAVNETKSVSLAIGGSGNGGGFGGLVDVRNGGVIETAGYGAYGILAQSIGGGGGQGGMAIVAGLGLAEDAPTSNVNAQIAVGGVGGGGNYGGIVNVRNEDRIQTIGENADAIMAQSIGGGGGIGGSSISGFLGGNGQADGRTINVGVSVGGAGGGGSYGGEVDVTNRGDLVTIGAGSTGITAQSIGGGGGSAGQANAFSILTSDACTEASGCDPKNLSKNGSLTVAVGGSGGSASDGGLVTVTNDGTIATEGEQSHAIFAQSIGGGGGNGANGMLGLGPLLGLPIPVSLIPFAPKDSVKLLSSVSIAVGGNAGASGDGGDVVVENAGVLSTLGDGASAVYAQSIGGGGGNGGSAAIGLKGKIGIGGADGTTGDGGAVTVIHVGNITTIGESSHGVFAQSVGGGGGTAGNVQRAFASSLNVGLGLGISQCAFEGITDRACGNGGNGGKIIVTTTSDINTSGSGALGIFAQSVGGGGGVAGDLGFGLGGELFGNFVGSTGGSGFGGEVHVTHNGNITTSGYGAHGIMAQSAGGQDVGRIVDVTLEGRIEVSGLGSSGLVMQSTGAAGGGNLLLNLTDGSYVSGGLTDFSDEALGFSRPRVAGVRFIGGANNELTNRGTVTTAAGVDGWAIDAGTGNDVVRSYGTLIGSVDLGSGENALFNEIDALFETGARVSLGDTSIGQLTNNGVLSIGGIDRVFMTRLTGDLLQADTGTLIADLDLSQNAADLLQISGSASLAGTIEVNFVNAGNALPGEHEAILVSTLGGLQADDVQLAVQPSVVIQFDALANINDTLRLNYSIDFAPTGGNGNQSAIGEYINRLQLSGAETGMETLSQALINIPDLQGYKTTMDQLSPEIYAAARVSAVFGLREFVDELHNCAASDRVQNRDSEYSCASFTLGDRSLSSDATSSAQGFTEDSVNITLANQFDIGGHWKFGVAIGYEETGLRNDSELANVNGDTLRVGMILRSDHSSSSMTFGRGNYRASRLIDLGDSRWQTVSDQNMNFVNLHSQLFKRVGSVSRYIRPSLAFDAAYVDAGAVYENEGGITNLRVARSAQVYASLWPEIEFAGLWSTNSGTTFRPYARVGLQHYIFGLDNSFDAVFGNAPISVNGFETEVEIDQTYKSLALGLDLDRGRTSAISIYYKGLYSGRQRNSSVNLKFSGAF